MAFPKVVVVTGASAGVGRATARLFAKKGADVALIARGIDGLEAAKREIEALGRRALVIPTDVSDPKALENAAAKTEYELGLIDVWVNAATHPRREIWVGETTVAVIQAQKFFPGLLDRYLARNGYDSQQYDGLADPNRPNNLWEPLPGDFGAHGDFDDRAHKRSWQST